MTSDLRLKLHLQPESQSRILYDNITIIHGDWNRIEYDSISKMCKLEFEDEQKSTRILLGDQ